MWNSKPKKIKSYEDFKAAEYKMLLELKQENPEQYERYAKKESLDRLKQNDLNAWLDLVSGKM